MMANYYEKLTKIFLMSGNALFHAAAWGRYYAIVTNIGGNSEKNSHDSLAKYSSALWQHLLVSTRKKLLRARERMLD